jgi:hypothetical protein
MGGATSFVGLIVTNIKPFTPHRSSLRRTLGDFLDHGERPTQVQPPSEEAPLSLLRSSDLLPSDFWNHIELLFPTHLSRTGWGSRSLSVSELGKLFGFPFTVLSAVTGHHPTSPSTLFRSFIPLPILDACLLPWLHSLPTTRPILPSRLPACPRRVLATGC